MSTPGLCTSEARRSRAFSAVVEAGSVGNCLRAAAITSRGPFNGREQGHGVATQLLRARRVLLLHRVEERLRILRAQSGFLGERAVDAGVPQVDVQALDPRRA
jgi:hypothetical protein